MVISMNVRSYARQLVSLAALSILLIAAQAFSATFTEPTVAPPNGNVEPPINTSTFSQVKKGALVVNQTAGANIGLFVPSGRIEIGDRAGTAVSGDVGLGIFGKKLRLVDGTEGDGKVLTSNANGLARWEDVTAIRKDACVGVIDCAVLSNGQAMIWGVKRASNQYYPDVVDGKTVVNERRGGHYTHAIRIQLDFGGTTRGGTVTQTSYNWLMKDYSDNNIKNGSQFVRDLDCNPYAIYHSGPFLSFTTNDECAEMDWYYNVIGTPEP